MRRVLEHAEYCWMGLNPTKRILERPGIRAPFAGPFEKKSLPRKMDAANIFVRRYASESADGMSKAGRAQDARDP
jgi:hypothetical protein